MPWTQRENATTHIEVRESGHKNQVRFDGDALIHTMPPSARLSLLLEAANLCHRLVRARLTPRLLLTRTSGKQYRPMPPGIDFSQGFNLLHIEELQRSSSTGDNESGKVDETAARVEESLREGLRMNLDYIETVSQNISHRLDVIKTANEFMRNGHNLERWGGSPEEGEPLKFALMEKISTSVAIRAHAHFLRFCMWLKRQEETGSTEERLFWERSLLEVHVLVKSEVEGALNAAVDVEGSRLVWSLEHTNNPIQCTYGQTT